MAGLKAFFESGFVWLYACFLGVHVTSTLLVCMGCPRAEAKMHTQKAGERVRRLWQIPHRNRASSREDSSTPTIKRVTVPFLVGDGPSTDFRREVRTSAGAPFQAGIEGVLLRLRRCTDRHRNLYLITRSNPVRDEGITIRLDRILRLTGKTLRSAGRTTYTV